MPTEALAESVGPDWRGEILVPRGLQRWSQLPVSGPEVLHRRRLPENATLVYLSSGNAGQPKAVAYTESDWHEGVSHRAECLDSLGVRAGDSAVVILPFGPWFSGDQICDALIDLGVRVLPAGYYGPHLPAVIGLMSTLNANVLVTTPSLAYLMPKDMPPMRLVILLGERCPPALCRSLNKRFGDAHIRSLYAASEAIIGPDILSDRDTYLWDRGRLHLEVLDANGRVRDRGEGELLVTRRYGEATPLIRYRLGDLVELGPGQVRFRGRVGHAFTLVSGVKLARCYLESFLDGLNHPISEARFHIEHQPVGDLLRIHLRSPLSGLCPKKVKTVLLNRNMDLADAVASGHVRLQVRCELGSARAKRRLVVEEYPWRL